MTGREQTGRFRHRLPFGAELEEGGVRFRLWAPTANEVELVVEGRSIPLERDELGFAEALVAVSAGARYTYRIDALEVPDPASRFQPAGVHGPSEVVDPTAYRWRCPAWRGRPWHETALYELHLGTFTEAGTCEAAIERLDDLRDLGVTAIELMPVAAAPGERGWGYDGVLIFAPNRSYGPPEALKRLVDEAHARGLMVFLDVVYNHFGPEGNYLHHYAETFFTTDRQTPWGAAIAVDGPSPVRRFFIENALYWLEEYRFDGLRLDAIHALPQETAPTFVEELALEVRRRIRDRHVHLVVENDDNRATLLARDGGRPRLYDAQWNDDFHHAIHVAATGEDDGYYRDYALPHLGRCLAEGFAYQGERSIHRGAPRGQLSKDLPPTAFVTFLQNHDQVGNRAFGERLSHLVDPERLDGLTTVALLAPSIPLLFMGEEWAASTPFLYFCDFEESLRDPVRKGRREEFASFRAFGDREALRAIPDPCEEETMVRSRLSWSEREAPAHRAVLDRYTELLALRKREIVPRIGRIVGARHAIDGAQLSVRYTGDDFTLGLDLNAGDEPVVRPRRQRERILAATRNLQTPHRLGRWGAIWWLES